MVLSVALVDAMIKDSDIVSVSLSTYCACSTLTATQIFRAVHHLLLQASHNPFISVPTGFKARHTLLPTKTNDGGSVYEKRLNPITPQSQMFATSPEDLTPETFAHSAKFARGIERLGELLSGGR